MLLFWPTFGGAQGIVLALHLEITPNGLRGPYGMLVIKIRLFGCMQGRCPSHSTIIPAPLLSDF